MMKSDFLSPASQSRSNFGTSQEVGLEASRRVRERLELERDPMGSLPVVEEETLVVDDRTGLSPAQFVESKLSRKLQETSLPVSHLQVRTLLRRR